MKQLLLLTALLLALPAVLHAQETVGAPYNPDSNNDSLINAIDLLDLIPLYAQPFLPSPDDLDSTNEIQSLFLSGDTLFLVPDGGFISLASLASGIDSTLSDLLGAQASLPSDTVQNIAIYDPDNDGEVNEINYWECATFCNRLTTAESDNWRVISMDDVAKNYDILLPAMLDLYPNETIPVTSDQSLYWTLDRNDSFNHVILLYGGQGNETLQPVIRSPHVANNGEDHPFGCMCIH